MVAAKEIMNMNVITMARDEDIFEAVRTMTLNHITGLPVLDEDGTLVGIITEKDVLTLLSGPKASGRVEDFMTRSVVCFTPQDRIDDIAECFRENHFRRVPVVEEGRLVGIVSRRDILRYIDGRQHESEVLKDSILEVLY
jgi:CBS domain-containing protein